MQKHWISIHIFYYSEQNHLIVDCIAPLVAQLREQGLLQRYFFIKYWAEGPHVRLRLLPTPNADEEKMKHLAEQAITAFLKRRPALYSIDHQKMAPLYKKLFVIEYGEQKWQETYGPTGVMPLRSNNSFAYIDYEPEYVRYGGPDGIELAEWHFEHSSDMVIDLLRETNVGVHSMLLGRSVQLTLPFFYGVFRQDDTVLEALGRYITGWLPADPKGNAHLSQYPKKYQRMASLLQQRVSKIRHYMLEEDLSSTLTETEKQWKNHINELRLAIEQLHKEQKIVLDLKKRLDGPPTLEDVYHYLLGSYIHMTNNRLGASIAEEIYVVYLLKRSLEDVLAYSMKEAV